MTKKLSLFFLISLFLGIGTGRITAKHHGKEHKINADGPYILYNEDGSARIITVSPDSAVQDITLPSVPKDFSVNVSDEKGRYHFSVPITKKIAPACRFDTPERLFIMSDPHGNFDCVVSLLKGNGIIDDNLSWKYGSGHLVIIGDVFDRGVDVLPIFWLFYKLEDEAQKTGGQLSFLLGNHETLVLMDDLRYTEKKYTRLAEKLGVKYSSLFGPNTELGRWLLSRNTIMQIGRNILVHAGLSRDFYDRNLNFEQVNQTIPLGLYKKKADRKEAGDLVYFLFANQGPIWYRGLVSDELKHKPIASDTIDLILRRYDADRIFVGHTIFDEPSPFYNQRVFSVNVENAPNREARKGRAYLFMQRRLFVCNDGGVIREIPMVE